MLDGAVGLIHAERIEATGTIIVSSDTQPLPICPFCGTPCPPKDGLTDERGRVVHKDCYRRSFIESL